MKRLSYKNIIWVFLAGLLYITSCTEKFPEDYTPYHPTPVTTANVDLKYDALQSYPVSALIKSDTPSYQVEGVYTFGIDTIIASDGGSFIYSKFSIDKTTGVITYDNTTNSITPGSFSVSVFMSNPTGIAVVDTAFKLSILDVPISISVDNPVVYANVLQQGVIATVTYKDESPDQSITSVDYSIDPAVKGFSIDSDGKINKTVDAAPNSTDTLTILAKTNLGVKVFKNVVVVHVGAPPAILYTQSNGTDTLHKVTVSPVTPYTSQKPVLTGMNSDGGWEIILADTVPQAVKDALSIDTDGKVSIAANANLPEGSYVVGVRVTNSSGISFDFTDLFTITIMTKWGEIAYTDAEFGDGTITYGADAASATSFTDGGGYAKGYHGADATFNSWIIAAVKLSSDWNGSKLQIVFDERNGWGAKQDPVYAETVRTLQYSYDQITWNDLMAPDDPNWATSGSGVYITTDAPLMENIDLSQSTIYLKWHYDNSASATKTKSVWMLDNLTFKYTEDFGVIEE